MTGHGPGISDDLRTEAFRRWVREIADLGKKLSDNYGEQALHAIDTEQRALLEGCSQGILVMSEFLAGAAEWDSPDESLSERARAAKPPAQGEAVLGGATGAVNPAPARSESDDDELSQDEYMEKYGEPRGAGADPFGRPDPRTHPEYWTE